MSYTAPAGLGATTEVTQATDQLAEAAALQIDPTKGRKYKTALAAAKWSGRQLDRTLTAFQTTKVGKITAAGGEMASSITAIASAARQGKYSADASGVVEVSMDATKFLGSFRQFASAVGGTAGDVMNEVAEWGMVAAGCAAGATVGPLGYVGCGFAVISKLFSTFFKGKPLPYVDAPDIPRTLFIPRNTAMPMIAQDALRLAQVLKHHYGIQTYGELADRIKAVPLRNDRSGFEWLYQAYPARPDIQPDGTLGNVNKPLPAHNLRTILQLLGGDSALTNDAGVSHALKFLAAVRSRDDLERDATGAIKGRPLWYRYQHDGDISESAIAHGAYIGRSAVANNGTAKQVVTINGIDWKYIVGVTKTQYDPSCMPEDSWCSEYIGAPQKLHADFLAFVQVDELINYFGGITIRELNDRTAAKTASGRSATVAEKLVEDYGFGYALPISQATVKNALGARSGEPSVKPKFEEEPECRTNLTRRPNVCDDFGPWLRNQVPETVRDAAAVRLCAAFSYIHMQYMWARKVANYTSDIIADVPKLNFRDPAHEMRLPVDPRQVVARQIFVVGSQQSGTVWTLHPNEKVGNRVLSLGKDRKKLPTQTALVRPSPQYQLPFARATSSPQVLAKRIDEHERIVQAAIAKMRAVMNTYNPQLATSIREHMRLVLQGGAAAAPGTTQYRIKQLQSQLRIAPKGSIAGPLVLGAAALLALKFLK